MKLLFRTMVVLLAVCLALPLGVVQAQAPPPYMPQVFYGEVTIGGVPASDGIKISAEIDDHEYASTTTSGGEYQLKVPGEDLAESGKQGGEPGDTVVFKVGVEVAASVTFDQGMVTLLPLNISGPSPVTYNLTVTSNPTAGGSVTLAPTQPAEGYAAGTSVQLTATAAGGYSFASWSGDLSGSINPDTITMDANKTITANFTEIGVLAVTTNAATGIGTTTATLNGYLTLGDAPSANVSFEWGTSANYGTETAVQTMDATGPFTASLPGLSPSTTYWFKAKAQVAGEEPIYGQGLRFTTRAISTDGGGGWAPPTYYIQTNLFGTEGSYHIGSSGKILETIEATSADGNLTITIPKDTIALDKDGNRLESLEAAVDKSPPAAPEDAHIIGLAYDFGPDGATFDPPITFTWSYDPDALPEDVAEEDLVIAYYDEAAGKWVELDGVVDTENNTITIQVSHFTTFVIIGTVTPPPPPPTPAAFTPGSLSISPTEVDVGEAVTISISVANTGGQAGSYTVMLKINDAVEETKEVTVAAGASETVTFTTSKDKAGTYAVDVNGLTGSFMVKEAAVSPPPPSPVNWLVIGGIIAAVVVVVGLLIFFLVRRRTRARQWGT